VVRVEPGAEVTVLENGPAAARFNKVHGGRGRRRRPRFTMSAPRGATTSAARHAYLRAARGGGVFKSFTLTVNGV
jgi:Fe-S cluster assembly protein SufD